MDIAKTSFQQLVEALDELIGKVGAAGLRETAALLSLARIDLILRVHGFSEAEFDAFLAPLRKSAVRTSRFKRLVHRGGRVIARC